jgi:nitrogenase molybdenum-iron protein beta chain
MGNIRNPRMGCALHGALATLGAIDGLIPIVHANAGCAMQHDLASQNNGGYIDGMATPSSNIIDKQVIFGGGARLREQIKNTLKVVDGRLYVVVGSCECAMVGDDLIGMAREAAEQGLPVLGSNIAGFHGDIYRGYERVFLDLIDGLPELESTSLLPHAEIDARPSVNLFGIVPGSNPYYKGDLEELRRILEAIGLRVNSFFGPGGSAALRALPHANLNLVFSSWGESIAARLEEKYETPQLIFDAAPLGLEEVSLFAQVLVEKLDLDANAAERFLEQEEALMEYFLLGAANRYFDEGAGKRAALVGDTETILRIGGFLSRFAAADIRLVVYTDRAENDELPTDLGGEAYATNDSGAIAEYVRASNADLVFASSLEAEAAQTLDAPLLTVSHPVLDRVIGNQTYVGLRGAVALGAEYQSLARQGRQARKERLARKIRSIAITSF